MASMHKRGHRPVSAPLPRPGQFSCRAAAAAASTHGPMPSAVLYTDGQVHAVKARSEGFGQRRLMRTEEKKRLHREQMVSKSTLADVSKMSRTRQVSRAGAQLTGKTP